MYTGAEDVSWPVQMPEYSGHHDGPPYHMFHFNTVKDSELKPLGLLSQ